MSVERTTASASGAYRSAEGTINHGMANSQAKTQTRDIRSSMEQARKQIDELEKKIQTQNAKLLETTDPKERELIKDNLRELRSQRMEKQAALKELSRTHAGSASGGGGVMTTTSDSNVDSIYGGGSSSSSSSSTAAVTSSQPTGF